MADKNNKDNRILMIAAGAVLLLIVFIVLGSNRRSEYDFGITAPPIGEHKPLYVQDMPSVSSSVREEPTQSPTSSVAALDDSNGAEAAAYCSLEFKPYLVSESSYKKVGIWRYVLEGDIGIVAQKYEATNGFGANLTSQWVCKFDYSTKEVVFLGKSGPGGDQVFIDKTS